MRPPFVRPPRVLQGLFPHIAWSGDHREGRVFLTFDDGPHPRFTPAVLDMLRDFQAHATFFLIGSRAAAHPEIVQRIVREGHTVGNHSHDHKRMAFRSRDWIRQQLLSTQQCIRRITGDAPAWFRPPYGIFDGTVLRVAEEVGVKVVIWSVLPYDTVASRPDDIVERVLENTVQGDIVDLHDGHARSGCLLEALPRILTGLRAEELDWGVLSLKEAEIT